MHWWQYVILGFGGFVGSVLSGITGGGGGFISTPLMIAVGMTPAQAVSTGKIAGLATTIGSLGGLRKSGERVAIHKILMVMALAFVVGSLAPLAITSLDTKIYRVTLGIVLLLMIPIVILKKVGIHSHKPSTTKKIFGSGLLVVALVLQGIFSGGLGTLVNLVLMGMLGMNVTEANITKRWSQLILNTTIVIGVLTKGLIMWPVVLVMVPITFCGSYLGAHIALRKGRGLVMKVIIGVMIASALYLILG